MNEALNWYSKNLDLILGFSVEVLSKLRQVLTFLHFSICITDILFLTCNFSTDALFLLFLVIPHIMWSQAHLEHSITWRNQHVRKQAKWDTASQYLSTSQKPTNLVIFEIIFFFLHLTHWNWKFKALELHFYYLLSVTLKNKS